MAILVFSITEKRFLFFIVFSPLASSKMLSPPSWYFRAFLNLSVYCYYGLAWCSKEILSSDFSVEIFLLDFTSLLALKILDNIFFEFFRFSASAPFRFRFEGALLLLTIDIDAWVILLELNLG